MSLEFTKHTVDQLVDPDRILLLWHADQPDGLRYLIEKQSNSLMPLLRNVDTISNLMGQLLMDGAITTEAVLKGLQRFTDEQREATMTPGVPDAALVTMAALMQLMKRGVIMANEFNGVIALHGDEADDD